MTKMIFVFPPILSRNYHKSGRKRLIKNKLLRMIVFTEKNNNIVFPNLVLILGINTPRPPTIKCYMLSPVWISFPNTPDSFNKLNNSNTICDQLSSHFITNELLLYDIIFIISSGTLPKQIFDRTFSPKYQPILIKFIFLSQSHLLILHVKFPHHVCTNNIMYSCILIIDIVQ